MTRKKSVNRKPMAPQTHSRHTALLSKSRMFKPRESGRSNCQRQRRTNQPKQASKKTMGRKEADQTNEQKKSKNKKASGKKFGGKCFNCGGHGHMAHD